MGNASTSFQSTHADEFSAMGMEDDLLALIDLIYEASFDSTLWPTALIRLADITGTAQVSLAAMGVAPKLMIRSPHVPIQSCMLATRAIGPSITRSGLSLREYQPARYFPSIALC